MRFKKPTRATIDQVRITREGNDAIIDYADSGIAGTRFTVGPGIATNCRLRGRGLPRALNVDSPS